MPKYRVYIHGINILLEAPDGRRKGGFYAAYFLEALTAESAGQNALELVRSDTELAADARNEPGDPPRFDIDEVEPIDSFDDFPRPRGGFIFYIEDE